MMTLFLIGLGAIAALIGITVQILQGGISKKAQDGKTRGS